MIEGLQFVTWFPKRFSFGLKLLIPLVLKGWEICFNCGMYGTSRYEHFEKIETNLFLTPSRLSSDVNESTWWFLEFWNDFWDTHNTPITSCFLFFFRAKQVEWVYRAKKVKLSFHCSNDQSENFSWMDLYSLC